MGSLSDTVLGALTGAFREYAERTRALSDGLTDEQFWTKPYSYGNSFGHLVLHLTGNLNTFIGADIAKTGYVRDREREFTDTSKRPKADVLRDFDAAIALVVKTLEAQSAESLTALPVRSGWEHSGDQSSFGTFFHCAAHLNHHVGQMVYLEKELHKTD